jgi:carbonic anhydrase
MEHRESRRQWLKMTAAGVAAMAAAPAKMLAQTAAPEFPKPSTPAEAVQLLLQGNERYLQQKFSECSINIPALRHDSEEHQQPYAAVLCCADSRMPAELVFDGSLGHLFVVRVAGNIATPDTIASLEYAVAVLGVKAILVVGHTNCGAVTAAKHGGTEPGAIAALFQYIYPATLGTADVAAAIEKNAQVQAEILRGSSSVIAERLKDGRLTVEPAVYNVGTGKVKMLERLKLGTAAD